MITEEMNTKPNSAKGTLSGNTDCKVHEHSSKDLVKARKIEYLNALLCENILQVMEKLSTEEVDVAFEAAVKDESELLSDERMLLKAVVARITLLPEDAKPYIPQVKDYEKVLTTGEAGNLLGRQRPTIKSYIKSNKLVGYLDGGKNLLPAWQFYAGEVVPGVDDVLSVLGENGVSAVRSFTTPLARLGDQSIIDVLREGDIEKAIQAAEMLVSIEW